MKHDKTAYQTSANYPISDLRKLAKIAATPATLPTHVGYFLRFMRHAHAAVTSTANIMEMEIDMKDKELDSVVKLVAQNIEESDIGNDINELMDSPLARFNRPLNMIAYEDQE